MERKGRLKIDRNKFSSSRLAEYEPRYNYLDEMFLGAECVKVPYSGSYERISLEGAEVNWSSIEGWKRDGKINHKQPFFILAGDGEEERVYRLRKGSKKSPDVYVMDFDRQGNSFCEIGEVNTITGRSFSDFNKWTPEDVLANVKAVYFYRKPSKA